MALVTSASDLNSLAERIIFCGMTAKELEKLAVLKPGKTFGDFKKAWETPLRNEAIGVSFQRDVAIRARRLFAADVIEQSLVPDDGF